LKITDSQRFSGGLLTTFLALTFHSFPFQTWAQGVTLVYSYLFFLMIFDFLNIPPQAVFVSYSFNRAVRMKKSPFSHIQLPSKALSR